MELSEEKKAIESFKKYQIFLNNELDDYYKIDEEFYKDQIEQLELSIKLLNKITNLIEKLQKENEELKKDISNMYDEKVVRNILENECGLSKYEIDEILN